MFRDVVHQGLGVSLRKTGSRMTDCLWQQHSCPWNHCYCFLLLCISVQGPSHLLQNHPSVVQQCLRTDKSAISTFFEFCSACHPSLSWSVSCSPICSHHCFIWIRIGSDIDPGFGNPHMYPSIPSTTVLTTLNPRWIHPGWSCLLQALFYWIHLPTLMELVLCVFFFHPQALRNWTHRGDNNP